MALNTHENTIRLAIVGARTMNNQVIFERELASWISVYGAPAEIVTGGAQGVDTLAENYARTHEIPCTIFKPDYDAHGRGAPLRRNTQIAERCTHILAFPSRTGRGTQDTLRKTIGKPTHAIWVN